MARKYVRRWKSGEIRDLVEAALRTLDGATGYDVWRVLWAERPLIRQEDVRSVLQRMEQRGEVVSEKVSNDRPGRRRQVVKRFALAERNLLGDLT